MRKSLVGNVSLAMSGLVLMVACSGAEFSATTPSEESKTPKTPNPVPTVVPRVPTPVTPVTPVVLPPLTGIIQPSMQMNVITFTPDNGGFYHLGDGNFEASSCQGSRWSGKPTVSSLEVKGTTFIFEFTVKEAQTMGDIMIRDICGIDYDELNTAVIKRDGVTINSYTIGNTGFFAGAFHTGNMNLLPGKYELTVTSPQNKNHPTLDRDDFVVGEVTVYSTKPLVKGTVTAK